MLGIFLSICAIDGSFLEKNIEISDDVYKWECLCIMSEGFMDIEILQDDMMYTLIFCSIFSISLSSHKKIFWPM